MALELVIELACLRLSRIATPHLPAHPPEPINICPPSVLKYSFASLLQVSLSITMSQSVIESSNINSASLSSLASPRTFFAITRTVASNCFCCEVSGNRLESTGICWWETCCIKDPGKRHNGTSPSTLSYLPRPPRVHAWIEFVLIWSGEQIRLD